MATAAAVALAPTCLARVETMTLKLHKEQKNIETI